MGWFSADEIVAPATANIENSNNNAQTIALCVLEAVATGYVLLKALLKAHRNHTVRVAERAARVAAAQV